MLRRQFLRDTVAFLTAAVVSGRSRARVVQGAETVPLATPIVVPRSRLHRPWQPVPFDAWIELPAKGDAVRERLLKGYLLRLGGGQGSDRYTALCRLCTHEHCWVDLRSRVPELRAAEAPKIVHPVLVCPCHTSVFDPAQDGAVVAGPAPRALYRFEIETDDREIAITAVEKDAL